MFVELLPVDGRKSFYHKALVEILDNGEQVLYSYNTKILSKDNAGNLKKYWHGWSLTTGRHIKAFAGLNKKQYENLG